MIIFYDGTCPLCNYAIRFCLAADKKQQFYYAPLNGKTAEKKLKDFHLKSPNPDTLILYQNPDKILIEGRAVLRILWLLGRQHALIGWLSFLPSIPFDMSYRVIARFRHHIFSEKNPHINHTERFLP